MTSAAPLVDVRGVGIVHEGSDAATPAAATFRIAPGEVVLLLGPSGSGKSTLALALNGLIPQSVPASVTGSVEVAGLDAATTPVARLSTHVGMVFQDPDAQLVTGTVLDEVAFGPENLRLPVDEVLARSEAALRRVGLWERRADNPDRLSGGGRQRLAIACALALGSPLLVLDEPTANLDPRGIEEVYAALADVVGAGDRSILLIEHNLDAAVGMTDRVVVLDADGRTVADGDVDAVLRERAEELHALGVWLPVSTLAGLRLRRAGYALDPLPLTPDELRAALEASASPLGEQRDAVAPRDLASRTAAPVGSASASSASTDSAPAGAGPTDHHAQDIDAPPGASQGTLTPDGVAPANSGPASSVPVSNASADSAPAGAGPTDRLAQDIDAPTDALRSTLAPDGVTPANSAPASSVPVSNASTNSAPASSAQAGVVPTDHDAPDIDAPSRASQGTLTPEGVAPANSASRTAPAADTAPSASDPLIVPPVERAMRRPSPFPDMRPTVVEARGLTLARGRTPVLHDVDLTVRAGEFVAIVGANGAGKTTLLQALAGVIPAPRGAVRVDGVDPARAQLRDRARRIGFVFQNPEHQFIAHTVFDELAHGLRLQRLADDEVRARTTELLRRFGLEASAQRHPFLLSGGQKRRLSVGTALVAGAPVLALDEPTFGQDRARADELLHLLRELNAAGTTIIVVTHDMQLVTDHASRTIVVADGRIVADAATSAVFADEALVERAGLRLPPLRRALRGVERHPSLAGIARLADLPGGDS